MNLILVGPPGSGKGTQGTFLIERYDLERISTGDLLRKAVAERTAVGMKARAYMDNGELVPDHIMVEIVDQKLGALHKGFILDGFPRTIEQARALDRSLTKHGQTIDAVIVLAVNDGVLVHRLTGRRVCDQCGENFHITTKPPREDGKCDQCGGDIRQRSDDKEGVIRDRITVYHHQTKPIIDFYRASGILHLIDGERAANEIFSDIARKLETA